MGKRGDRSDFAKSSKVFARLQEASAAGGAAAGAAAAKAKAAAERPAGGMGGPRLKL